MRGKDLLRRGAIPLEQRYYGNARIFRDGELAGVLRQYDPRRSHTDVTAPYYAESAGWDPVARMQHVDLFTWLRGDILVKADKMTMANSLELRVPFLDPEVFAVASGAAARGEAGREHHEARAAQGAAGIVPPHVLHRRKLGFPVPIRHWLRDEMYDWARGIVRDSQADHLVDLAAVTRMLDAHRDGRSTTAAASGRCWCSCSGTGSSSSSGSPRRSPSPPTRCALLRAGRARRADRRERAGTRLPGAPGPAVAMRPARARRCAADWSAQQRPSRNRSGSAPGASSAPPFATARRIARSRKLSVVPIAPSSVRQRAGSAGARRAR